MFTFAPPWDLIIFGLIVKLPTGYQCLYQSPTSLDCRGLPSVRDRVGDQLGQPAQGAISHLAHGPATGGLRSTVQEDTQLLIPCA